jgi:uncharacterized protein (TIGR02598 family)
MKANNYKCCLAGFTLIEIALALLVVSIGIMAVLGLFPAGLDANRRAIEETRAAIFADDVMNSYRAASRRIPWQELAGFNAPGVATNMWHDFQDLEIQVNQPGQQNVYTNIYALYDDTNTVEYAVRYRFTMADESVNTKSFRLEVWPGEFGQTEPEDALVFITELFNSGITAWPPN